MESTQVRVDYMTVLIDLSDAVRILDIATWDIQGPSPYPSYEFMRVGPFGCRAHCSEGRALVQLPGKYWAALQRWRNIAIELLRCCHRVNRVDLCTDLERGSLLDRLIECRAAERIVGCRVYSFQQNNKGRTLYLGSRQSDVMLRCYDMRGPERVEIEIKGEYAQAALPFLKDGRFNEVFYASASRFRAVVVGGVNRARAKLCDWWADFLAGRYGTVEVVKASYCMSMDKTAAWLKASVKNALAAAVKCYGEDWLVNLLESGNTSKYDRALTLESRAILGAL